MGSIFSKSESSESFGSPGSFLEYNQVINEIKIGDLIEIHPNGNGSLNYEHWVMCESIDSCGTVWCFHITAIDHRTNGRAVLEYELLEDILYDTADRQPPEERKPSLCRVNNQQNMARKMLATLNNEMPDFKDVFKLLHRMKDKVFKFDLMTTNCEHYCTLWKYGIGWSTQINTYQDIVSAGLQVVSKAAKEGLKLDDESGCHIMGKECLLISTVSSLAAEVVKGIEFTLNDLKL